MRRRGHRAGLGQAGLGEDLWTRLGRSTPPVLTRYVVTEVADEHTLDIERARRVLGYAPRWTYVDGPVGDDSVRDAPQLAGHSHASADATPGR